MFSREEVQQVFFELSLDEISKFENLTQRAYNVCKMGELFSLRDILSFYLQNESFLSLPACGKQSNLQLIDLSRKFEIFLQIENDLSLEKLNKYESLSTRTSNICVKAGLVTLAQIVKHFKEYGAFLNLASCGDQSNAELVRISKYYENYYEILAGYEKTTSSLNSSDPSELMTIEQLLKSRKISIRAFNVCSDTELYHISDLKTYFYKFKSFHRLKNCGNKTCKELELVVANYSDGSPKNDKYNVQNNMKFCLLEIKNKYNVEISDFQKMLQTQGNDSYLPIFQLIDILLVNSDFFDDIEKEIYLNLHRNDYRELEEIGSKVNLSSERIRQKRKTLIIKLFKKDSPLVFIPYLFRDFIDPSCISNERVITVIGDLVINMNQTIRNQFSENYIAIFLAIINKHLFLAHRNNENKKNAEVLFDTNKTAKFKNSYLITNRVSKQAIHKLFSSLFMLMRAKRENQLVISKVEILVSSISFIKRDYKSLVSMANELKEEISVQVQNLNSEFIDEVFPIVIKKTSEGISDVQGNVLVKKFERFSKKLIKNINILKIRDFNWTRNDNTNVKITNLALSYKKRIFKAQSDYRSILVNEIKSFKQKHYDYFEIIGIVFYREFGIKFKNSMLHLDRNTEVKRFEYVYEILRSANHPLHVSEICKAIIIKFPDLCLTESIISQICYRNPIFVCVGRTSVYGLKEWEKTNPNFKGGTIRKILEDYLRNKGKVHVNDVLQHVNKFRNTTIKSIITNIKADKSSKIDIIDNEFFRIIESK